MAKHQRRYTPARHNDSDAPCSSLIRGLVIGANHNSSLLGGPVLRAKLS